MSSATMRAVVVREYGSPEQLRVESVARPEPKAKEVLVRVMSAGVDPVDWKRRSGQYKAFMPVVFPWTPGVEGAGIVQAVGTEVKDFRPAQAVFGVLRHAYAEYALAAEGGLCRKPPKLSFDEAATIALGSLTAWKAVVEDAQVSKGQRVLILGAAGGVGSFGLQFARWKGAEVTATASSANAEYLKSLGAAGVIDYRIKEYEKELQDFDLVFDTIGGETLDRAYSLVRKGGVLVTVVGQVSAEKAEGLGIRAIASGQGPTDRLKPIVELIESGQVRLRVGATFSLDEVAKAHELGQTGHGRGRIVLHIAD